MQDLYLGKTNYEWIQNIGAKMNRLEYGSKEYTKCQKIFAFLCNRQRIMDKVNIEANKNGSNN